MKRPIPGAQILVFCGLLLLPGCVGLPNLTASSDVAQGELPPKDAAQVCLSVAAMEESKGHSAEAIDQYEKARLYDPSLKDIGRHLAVLYDRMGKAEAALKEYRRALEASPRDADLHNDLGYFYYQRGKWAEAETSFRASLALGEDNPRAWNNLGMTLAQERRYEDSLAAFLKAVGPADAYCNLGFVYMTQGNREEARRAYRQALEQDSTLEVARAALAKLEDAQN